MMTKIYDFMRIDGKANIVGRERHPCSDEAEALELACKISDGCIVEVWCGDQFVATIKPDQSPARAM